MKQQIVYFFQAILAYIVVYFFRLMPVDLSSSIGGFIGKRVLYYSKRSKIARDNLQKVYPEKDNKEINLILNKMWNNIGRNIGESIHLEKIIENYGTEDVSKRVNVKGIKNVSRIMKDNKPIVFVSGHLGNWEIIRAFNKCFNRDMGCIYREPNNPYVRSLLSKIRKDEKYKVYRNNANGVKEMTKDIKSGLYVGLLVDQWLTSGSFTKFLGIETKAPSLYGTYVKKYNAHLVPIQFKRINDKCKFELIFHPEIQVLENDTKESLTDKVNEKLTEFINEKPEDWLWIHKRFKK